MNLNNIFICARYGNLEDFKKVFRVELINNTNHQGNSLLQCSIIGGRFDISEFLINEGINVDIQNKDGETALHHICVFPNMYIAEKILGNSKNIDLQDRYGNNPLWTACHESKGIDYGMVRLFMKFKPNIHNKNKVNKSPFDLSIDRNYVELKKILEE